MVEVQAWVPCKTMQYDTILTSLMCFHLLGLKGGTNINRNIRKYEHENEKVTPRTHEEVHDLEHNS
jgi:hypothetical protein